VIWWQQEAMLRTWLKEKQLNHFEPKSRSNHGLLTLGTGFALRF
jgi:hypothetical protein